MGAKFEMLIVSSLTSRPPVMQNPISISNDLYHTTKTLLS